MRKLALALCLAFSASAIHAQTNQPISASAPAVGAIVSVHVTASHVVPCWGNACSNLLYLDVVIDGKKYELQGSAFGSHKIFNGRQVYGALLPPGDYRAKLTKDLHSAPGLFYQEYELLLPGNFTWKCVVTGVSE